MGFTPIKTTLPFRLQKKSASSNGLLYARRLGQTLSCVFVFFAVGYLVLWCLDPAHFPITSVRFIGERKYLSQQVLKAGVLPEVKKGFFRLKVSSLQEQLLSLAWVKKVAIRKVWPDQLVINYEEHEPAAFWGERGILNVNGGLFYPDLSLASPLELPKLQGPEGKSDFVWQQYLVMEQTIAPLRLSITHLTLAPRGAWHLKLSNGITVILGTNDVLSRLSHFVWAYEKRLQSHQAEIAYVDLRYTQGLAVGWRSR